MASEKSTDFATVEILLVDDERLIRDGYRTLLAGEGFSVRTARDGEEALRKFAERRPGLVLLDVMMPGMNGFRTCEEIRKLDRRVPILFLTAMDSEVNQVRGLGLGADDYISKTTPESVLLARVRRALERADAVGVDTPSSSVLRLDTVSVDFARLEVLDERGTAEPLTATEAGILQLLSAQPGRFFSVDELVASLRGEGYACEDSMLYSHVSRLRRKLGADGERLACSRGSGYRLVTE